jgi:membrane-associated phospholipid phosphatase
LRSSEWIAFSYFLYLGVVSWFRPLRRQRRLIVLAVSVALLVTIRVGAAWFPPAVRDWAPFAYVSVGYYLPGLLSVAPSLRFEGWLRKWDRRMLGNPATFFAAWPAWLVGYFEIVYMSTFLLLPMGFGVLVANGRSDLSNHYWTMVLAADLGAFAPVALVQTRPPWALEPPPALADTFVHRMASRMVRGATIGINTFPSGHVAVSLAIAAVLSNVLPVAAMVFLIFAVSIAVACVLGRYHYTIDVIAGVGLAIGVWAAIAACGL